MRDWTRVSRAVRFPRFNNDFTMISREFSAPLRRPVGGGGEGHTGDRACVFSRCDLAGSRSAGFTHTRTVVVVGSRLSAVGDDNRRKGKLGLFPRGF